MQQETHHRQLNEAPHGPLLDAPITRAPGAAQARLALQERHQGWMELPHGGILMSMVLELAHRGLESPVFVEENYPVRTEFRLGGPTLSLRDLIEVGVQREGKDIRGYLKKRGETTPSLEAGVTISQTATRAEQIDMDRIALAMEGIGREAGSKTVSLPYSRRCFVCGEERDSPGLRRKFFLAERNEARIVFAYMGLDPDDQERLHRFRLSDGQIHPGSLIAVLDETLGWSGFVQTRQGGVTVRLEVDVFRSARPGDKMLFFGMCTGIRGKGSHRQCWYSEGGIIPMGEEDPSPIMTARGQWLAMPKLTEEMKLHLMPPDWTRQWFEP